jgi:hypothetical protein
MMDDDRLQEALRSAIAPAFDGGPARDLWPLIEGRMHEPVRRSWLDIGMAAGVLILLTIFPEFLLMLAYHL